jgi:hypothetical protein
MDDCVTRPRLYINHPAHLDWLIALEFGRVGNGQPPECWEDISARIHRSGRSDGGKRARRRR